MMANLKAVFLSNWLDNPYKKLLIKHLEPKGVKVREYRWSIFFLPKVIWPWKPDILHLHTLHPFLRGKSHLSRWLKLLIFVSQISLLRLLGTKTVWTVHEWNDKIGRRTGNISQSHGAILGRFIHSLITHCQSTQQEVAQAFGLEKTEKVLVVPHGNYIRCYENQIGQQEARTQLGIATEPVVFLILGGLYRHKGILEAIQTFKTLPQEESTLVIAGALGESDLEPQLKDMLSEHSNNILFIPKRIRDDELQIYLNACDAVILPYKVFTTSGMAILAMSFGRACIAPNRGFFPDVLDHRGAFLYDDVGETGLLTAMKQAVEQKSQLHNMGQHNFNLAQQWNWDFVANETFNIYSR